MEVLSYNKLHEDHSCIASAFFDVFGFDLLTLVALKVLVITINAYHVLNSGVLFSKDHFSFSSSKTESFR